MDEINVEREKKIVVVLIGQGVAQYIDHDQCNTVQTITAHYIRTIFSRCVSNNTDEQEKRTTTKNEHEQKK